MIAQKQVRTWTGSRKGRGNATPSRVMVPLFVGLAIMLGGASAPVSTFAFLLQVISAGLMAFATFQLRSSPLVVGRASAVAACAFLSLVIVQLVPLPAEIWTALPGRAFVAESMALANVENAWLPVSLTPERTIASALAILPPACLIVLLLRQGTFAVQAVAMVVVGFAFISFLIGVAQIQGGADSPLYVHHFTNWDLAVGSFANANHLATLLLVSIPFFAALAVRQAQSGRVSLRYATAAIGAYVATIALGIYLTGSVAGALLLFPTLAASLLLTGRWKSWSAFAILVVLVALALAGMAAWSAGSLQLLSTSLGVSEGGRLSMARNTLAAAWHYWPVGSGLGSFSFVYPLFEAAETVTPTYANHAHNDYLELLMETGLAGALFIAGFLGWWAWRVRRVWSSRRELSPETLWQRTVSIAIGIALAHSLVDYPLRTPAILVIFVFCSLYLATGSDAADR